MSENPSHWDTVALQRIENIMEQHLWLVQRVKTLEALHAQMFTVMIKEFPKYFAADTALGIVTNDEELGGEMLPDITPVDLRTAAEIANGECFRLTDMVAMDAG